MSEAGRLADLQEELRDDGVELDVVMLIWDGTSAPEPGLVLDAADYFTDADDPDRNFPVLGASTGQLTELMDYESDHPARCVVNPDRTISWCAHGHRYDGQERQAILDAWSAAQ